ncbi:MAG: hypothetical protein NZL89_04665 [Leptospiraceae bacterium]|nr:hypothetical protein [Leptospiraceae bacterium]
MGADANGQLLGKHFLTECSRRFVLLGFLDKIRTYFKENPDAEF